MLDWGKVKNDKVLLKRVEELVESVCDTFHDFPQDICDELNKLTGNDWEGVQYIEYCAEYWESCSLEQTVWALFHDGYLPDEDKFDLHIFRPLVEVTLPHLKIRSKLASIIPDVQFLSQFEELPQNEILEWFSEYFKTDWESDYWEKPEKKDGNKIYDYGSKNMYLTFKGEREYGFEQTIGIYLKNNKNGYIAAHNLSEENKEAIRKYFDENKGYKVFED